MAKPNQNKEQAQTSGALFMTFDPLQENTCSCITNTAHEQTEAWDKELNVSAWIPHVPDPNIT